MRSSELLNLLWTAFRCRILSFITFAKKKEHYRQKSQRMREVIYSLNADNRTINKMEPDQLADLTKAELGVFHLLSAMPYLKESK